MKKSLFIFAAAALALTACSSDNESTQNVTQKAAPQAVAFDTYVPNATRAGDAGIQTTTTLQASGKGFGVFAQHSDNADYAAATGLNFMYNEHITYSASAWTYSPLKYWPNETDNDSQTTDGAAEAPSDRIDKLSFFAYAPYVKEIDAATGKLDLTGDGTTDKYSAAPTKSASNITSGFTGGIEAIVANDETTDGPWVRYAVAETPANSVDLLWGVAPSGGLSYTNVSAGTTTVTSGLPLINLIKPAKDQKIKFLFKHALARLGLTVVAALDQIAPGGEIEMIDDDANPLTPDVPTTKIYVTSVAIDEVTTTNLYKTGTLYLKNTNAGEALWDQKSGAFTGLSVSGASLNDDIEYTTNAATSWASSAKGVTTSEKKVIADDKYFMVIPSHADTKLQVTIVYHVVTKDTKLDAGYSDVTNEIKKTVTIPGLTNNKAYNLKLVLGLTSVKLDAEVADWQVDGGTEVYLPRNNE